VLESGESRPCELDVSVVIACLDEAETIAGCVREAAAAIEASGLTGEVLVVDNGSTDGSASLAEGAGAGVVHEPVRGYGRAYLRGFAHARGRLLFMADGDGTYDFGALAAFVAEVRGGADLVIGSRLRGMILPGALARWRTFGNIVLTTILNALYRTRVTDAHCGQRMLRRDALERMRLSSPGMEFATEMIVTARRAGLRISEVPVVYRPRREDAPSKLRSIPDGLRHVRYMVMNAA
jgi:glycosyltransferase involved in cell wall biosynthesis